MSVVLITGANGGLGQAMARAFLEASVENTVWLGVRSAREKAEAMVADYPERCRLVTLDVTSTDDWQAAVETVVTKDGRLDVLVNNAGNHDDGLLAMMSDESWHSVVQSNLTGAFYGCRAVSRTMMGQRFGRIINISSLSAIMAPPGQANYAAAKAGVVGMTHSFAKEVARSGITVNAVCPGYIETEALSYMSPEQKKAAAMRVPMRRLGNPEEVASVVLFLASQAAGYVTGESIKIDGGTF